jgi:hypothetical protein
MKTTIKCAAWTSEKFRLEITLLFPGINLGRAQSGQQTNTKLMKNKPNKVTEVRHLSAKAERINHNVGHDGVDRRGFLKCMAWAGTGMLWTVSGGVLGSAILSPVKAAAAESLVADFSFVQLSDSRPTPMSSAPSSRPSPKSTPWQQRRISFCTPGTCRIFPSQRNSTRWINFSKPQRLVRFFMCPANTM